jgi:hypothetical protein
MSDPAKRITASSDESQKAESGGANVRLELVAFDKPLLVALAMALSLFTLIGGAVGLLYVQDMALQAQRDAKLAQYYNIDLEVYMAKQSMNPPSDPWRSKQPKEKRK